MSKSMRDELILAQAAINRDTIKLDGRSYRRRGIHAGEQAGLRRLVCWSGCDPALVGLVKGKWIDCEPKATDHYGRTVAIGRAAPYQKKTLRTRGEGPILLG